MGISFTITRETTDGVRSNLLLMGTVKLHGSPCIVHKEWAEIKFMTGLEQTLRTGLGKITVRDCSLQGKVMDSLYASPSSKTVISLSHFSVWLQRAGEAFQCNL